MQVYYNQITIDGQQILILVIDSFRPYENYTCVSPNYVLFYSFSCKICTYGMFDECACPHNADENFSFASSQLHIVDIENPLQLLLLVNFLSNVKFIDFFLPQ